MSVEATAVGYGGTRWRRFTLVFGIAFGLIATVVVLMAKGVLAAPVTISGTEFQVTADSLVAHTPDSGPAFIQYGFIDQSSGGSTGVAVTDLPAGGVLTNLDQTVCGKTPIPGVYLVVELKADKADATGGLIVDATKLNGGTATFNNIQIGVPAPNSIPDAGAKGSFAQTASGVSIDSLDQRAVYTQAGTFKLTNLGLSARLSSTCPY
jgi:Family of unknown function (DUF6230)